MKSHYTYPFSDIVPIDLKLKKKIKNTDNQYIKK